jgi:hypothetical protein
VDGITFDSKKEARRYCALKLLEYAGNIKALKLQPPYPMVVAGKKVCTYRGDFEYVENGKLICEDAKGVITREYRIKKKLFAALYPSIEHRET